VDGDAIDWAYGELGMAGFTTELSGGTFFPAYTSVEGIWNQNRGMLIYSSKIARTPYLLAHGPDANLVATAPITVPQGTPSHLTATINYAWTGNTMSQIVGAAEYYVDTPPWAGGTPIAMTATDGAFDETSEAVESDVDSTALSLGRHIVFVQGRGANDFAGYQTWGPITATFLWVTEAVPVPPLYLPLFYYNAAP
jgi:hypothetical protein